jgi:hypothetical protein
MDGAAISHMKDGLCSPTCVEGDCEDGLCWPARVDDSNEDGLRSPVRVNGGCEDGVSRGCEDGIMPAALPFSLASATDVHMPLPVTPKYKSSLPLSVSLHIINQREHMHCILISDQ